MKKLITILYFSVFVIASFYFVALTPFFMLFGQSENSKKKYRKWLCSFFRRYINHLPLVDFKVDNPYAEDFSKPSIIICNHQSLLDMAALLAQSPNIIALTNDSVWNSKIYGNVIHYSEFYPISMGIEESLVKMRSLLDRGYSILVFPEGTRSEDCKILKFRTGAFYLAELLKVDVLPVYVHDFGKRLPKTDLCLTKGQMTLEIGKRVPYGDDSMGLTHLEMKKCWHKHYCEKFAQ